MIFETSLFVILPLFMAMKSDSLNSEKVFRETLVPLIEPLVEPLVEHSKGARVSVLVEGARVQSGAKGIILDLSITNVNSEKVSIIDPLEGLSIQVKNGKGERLQMPSTIPNFYINRLRSRIQTAKAIVQNRSIRLLYIRNEKGEDLTLSGGAGEFTILPEKRINLRVEIDSIGPPVRLENLKRGGPLKLESIKPGDYEIKVQISLYSRSAPRYDITLASSFIRIRWR